MIRHTYEDSTGAIWVSTGNGFNKLDPDTQKFTGYHFDVANVNKTVGVIYEDKKGSSKMSGERSPDFEEEVSLVAKSVSHPLDDLYAIVDPL